MRIILMMCVLVAALGFAQEPLPAVAPMPVDSVKKVVPADSVLPIDYLEFDKKFGQVKIVKSDWQAVWKELDECLTEIKSKRGILLDVRACSTAADTNMALIMGRFTKHLMVADWIEIAPRGEWQYGGPLVVWLSEAMRERQFWELFLDQRKHGEWTTTNSQKEARAQLKTLATRIDAEQADRMQKLRQKNERKKPGIDPNANPRVLKPK